jgi:hypothetical protein
VDCTREGGERKNGRKKQVTGERKTGKKGELRTRKEQTGNKFIKNRTTLNLRIANKYSFTKCAIEVGTFRNKKKNLKLF